MEVLLLMSEIFSKIRKEGLVSIEADVDNPEESKIFSNYPKFLKNHHAVSLVADTLRTVMTTSIAPHELESLLDTELEAHHEESLVPSKSINTTAEAFPGLGIVAAVMGVVVTMQYVDSPPAVLGGKIAAALVGTFLGVLMCYGFVGPLSKNIEHIANEDKEYLNVLKVALVAFVGGAAPQIAVEFGRRVVPANVKPAFVEVEEAIRELKKIAHGS
jgi:chemotaxis protein MotA